MKTKRKYTKFFVFFSKKIQKNELIYRFIRNYSRAGNTLVGRVYIRQATTVIGFFKLNLFKNSLMLAGFIVNESKNRFGTNLRYKALSGHDIFQKMAEEHKLDISEMVEICSIFRRQGLPKWFSYYLFYCSLKEALKSNKKIIIGGAIVPGVVRIYRLIFDDFFNVENIKLDGHNQPQHLYMFYLKREDVYKRFFLAIYQKIKTKLF